jgi:hypothetical protein
MQGYFLAYRGFGDEGKEKRWLDKEIDHIGNRFPINYAKHGNFKFFHKGKVIAAKKRKSLFFSPSIKDVARANPENPAPAHEN